MNLGVTESAKKQIEVTYKERVQGTIQRNICGGQIVPDEVCPGQKQAVIVLAGH